MRQVCDFVSGLTAYTWIVVAKRRYWRLCQYSDGDLINYFWLIKTGGYVLKRSGLLVIIMSLAACGGVDPNSPLGKRTAIFKEMLNVSEDLGGMLRGRIKYDEALFIEKAVELDTLAKQPWQHFPSVKDDDKTSARDDVWQQQERFQELARALEGTTARLVASTTQPPLNESVLALSVQAVEDACESCHKEFRAY